MNVSCYLRVKAKRTGYGSIKTDTYFKPVELAVTKNKPDTGKDEIAIKVNLVIPNSIFLRPALEANIILNEIAVNPVGTKVVDNLSEILSNELGQTVHLTIGEPDD